VSLFPLLVSLTSHPLYDLTPPSKHLHVHPPDSLLPSIGIDTVVASLRERYLASYSYTRLSPSAIVSLNPLKPTSDSHALQVARSAYYDTESAEERREEPHVFGLAGSVYYHMKRTGQDQSVLTT
jgi:chitin synthase